MTQAFRTVDARGKAFRLPTKTRLLIKELGAVWDKDEKVWKADVSDDKAELICAAIASVMPKVMPIDYRVAVSRAMRDKAEDAVSIARSEFEGVCCAVVNETLGTKHYSVDVAGWLCDASPIGTCVYQPYDHHHCLFCHDPRDRS